MTISFSDAQLQVLMAAARSLPPDARSDFLQVNDQLRIKDVNVADAADRAGRFPSRG